MARHVNKAELEKNFGATKANIVALINACIEKCELCKVDIDKVLVNRKVELFLQLDEKSEIFKFIHGSGKLALDKLKQNTISFEVMNFLSNITKLELVFYRKLKSIAVKEKEENKTTNPGIKKLSEREILKSIIRLKDETSGYIHIHEGVTKSVVKKHIKKINEINDNI